MGEAWFSVLALEYYVHLSGLKRHEETIGSGGCRCAVDVRIKPPYQIDGGVQPHLPPLFHFCYEVRFLGTFVTIRKPGTESLSHEVYYFYLKVPVFVLAYGDQYLFDLTSAIQWVQLIQCIINDIIFFCDGILPSVLSQENGTWFPFNQDSRLWPCPVSKPNAKPTYFSWVNTLYWSKNHHGSEAWHSNLRQEHQAELVSYAKSAPPPGQVGMAGDRGMCNLRKTDIC